MSKQLTGDVFIFSCSWKSLENCEGRAVGKGRSKEIMRNMVTLKVLVALA